MISELLTSIKATLYDRIVSPLSGAFLVSFLAINYKAVFIFMLPPSLKDLEVRLNQRDTETENTIRERMEVGKNEIKQLTLYDYILTNFDVEETAENLLSIIRAERCRIELYQPSSLDLGNLLDNKVNT